MAAAGSDDVDDSVYLDMDGQLTPAFAAVLKEVFEKFDADHDGYEMN
jgi:hypothetical protein